jgi:hypothetical protein
MSNYNAPFFKTSYSIFFKTFISIVILGLDPGIHLEKFKLDSRLRGNDGI